MGFSRRGQGADRAKWITVFTLLLLITVGTTSAFADSEPPPGSLPTSQEIAKGIESESDPSIGVPATDPGAAENVAHRELGRSEALELLQGVFEPELQSAAGIFDELHVEKFLAPNVAVIPAGEQPGSISAPAGEESGSGHYEGPTLMDSTVPLGVEGPSGKPEAVDLSLERNEGALRPTNPIVEVAIPAKLGEGIELPESNVGIELEGAPEGRAPSTLDKSVAFYPNVNKDTDLAVSPTPTGVETLTQLRSAESPRSETFKLTLPSGTSLQEEAGGVSAIHEGKTILSVAPPAALDASGAQVPVSLEVSGDSSLTLTVSPEESTMYPIIVDPLFQSYEWYAKHSEEGINPGYYITGGLESEQSFYVPEGWDIHEINHGGSLFDWPSNVRSEEFQPYVPYGARGLVIESREGTTAGNELAYVYAVPRYFTDPKEHEGNKPKSFITKMTITDMVWKALSEGKSPYVYMGLWEPKGWASLYSHEGLKEHSVINMSWVYTFNNGFTPPDEVKIGEVGIYSPENVAHNAEVLLFAGAATVELAEPENVVPTFGALSGPSQWVNQSGLISATVSDPGLGVSSISIVGEQGSPPPSWKWNKGCVGVTGSPCPYTWHPGSQLKLEAMPTGIDTLKVTAEDPLGHVSEQRQVEVKVDHTAPELSLSGSITEQAKLGTKRATYGVKYNATDGTAESPQSGIAKVAVKVDGSMAYEEAPGCSTKNCSLVHEWTLESSKYSAGQHTVEVIATDGVGLTTTKTLTITLQPSRPTLTLSGTITEQGSLGTTRPRYKLKMSAAAETGNESPPPPATPTFSSSFGTAGTGGGKFESPGDVALDSKGDLWVVDDGNNRVEEFNEAGEFIETFGKNVNKTKVQAGGSEAEKNLCTAASGNTCQASEAGTANGQLSRPTALALDAKGNVWVADAGNNRAEEFNQAGGYLGKIGSQGEGDGQFSEPEGIAIDSKGNIWVSDTYNGRVQKFNEAGEFIKVVGSEGSGERKLGEPTGIDISPTGNVWVADWQNNRVEEFSESGDYLSQFGSEPGQFKHPDGLVVDTKGDVWVADEGNDRVQEFNQSGKYMTRFGSAGFGEGQFNLGYPMGIAVDSKGNLWITDSGNNRVQRWQIPDYVPTYRNSFGSLDSGAGHLSSPQALATDSEGNVWVADTKHNRIQEFNPKGEYVRQFGGKGWGIGELSEPKGIALDSKGNVWVADTGNNRVEEFNPKGEYVRQFGSAGNGNGQFRNVQGIAIDPQGHVWAVDASNVLLGDKARIQEFTPEGTFMAQIGSEGTENGQYKSPHGIAIDSGGNIWIADTGNKRIEEFNPKGEYVRKFGSEGSEAGQFKEPIGVSADSSGNVWVTDTGNDRIESFSSTGSYLSQFGTPGDNNGQFSAPKGIAVDSKGNVWVADTGNNRVEEATAGEYIRQFGGEGSGPGHLSSPQGIATDSEGNVWVADTKHNRIQEFNPKGEFVRQFGGTGSGHGQLSAPRGLAVDSKGNIWVADTNNNRVEEFGPKGEFVRQFGSSGYGNGQFYQLEGVAVDPEGHVWALDAGLCCGTYKPRLQEFNAEGGYLNKFELVEGSENGQLKKPEALAIDSKGNIWVADTANNRVEEFGPKGEFVRKFGSEGTENGQFKNPQGIAVDAEGNVWVTDTGNDRIESFSSTGTYLSQFGAPGDNSGQFSAPQGIAADASGNIWVADTANDRVQEVGAGEYVRQFGGEGSGAGQLSEPQALAADSEGNVWVADTAHNRIQEFNPKGEFVRQFGGKGSGNGELSGPKGIALDSKGDIYVADSGNFRVEEFDPKGEYVRKFGSKGAENGQFRNLQGVVIDPEGHLWTVDASEPVYGGKTRIQEFSSEGAYITQFGSLGTENGQFKNPQGIATDAEGSLWVADVGNNRVQEFNPKGEFLRKLGSEGTGNGQFKEPAGIATDSEGNVWVADTGNDRVEEFSPTGAYLSRFGTAGDNDGQFSAPKGIATDIEGDIWVADTGNDRVQRWSRPTGRSVVTTEITVDGKRVDSGESRCITEYCPVTREWALESSAYSVGKHTVVAKAADGFENTTSKTLTIEVQRDGTKPTLEAGGELVNAPEGWVQQESYGLHATATDGGAGVASVAFKIDGSTVASKTQQCVEGGCEEGLSKQIDMHSYSGGAHEAELVATDGAGNSTTKRWTINVDPEGHISTAEATATLEAVEGTTEETPVAPSKELLEPEQIEGGDNPGLQQSGSEITSTGVPDTTTMTTNSGSGFTIQSPEGSTKITPTVSENSSSVTIAEGVAGVSANVGTEVDSVIRPEYNGVQTFRAIRSENSPTSYSWTVHLGAGQSLHEVGEEYAEVVNENGTVAFLITAEEAHDATGAKVPTSIEVSGNVVTLNVEFHSASFVYPVTAGASWETSYKVPVIVEGPEDEAEILQREREERERAEREQQGEAEEAAPPPPSSNYFSISEAQNMIKAGAFDEIIPAPVPPASGGGATASSVEVKTVKPFKVCQSDHCSIWHVELKNPSYFYKLKSNNHWTSYWEAGTQVHSSWYYPWYYAPELNVEGNGQGFVGQGQVWSGEHKHLTAWGRYTITATGVTIYGDVISERNYLALQIWVWPNGDQQRVIKHWTPNPEVQEA